MSSPVITRFAPSPTGYLHIGGARTALFNWAYAKGQNGKMLLRIEDTDRERYTQGAVDAILDGMKWLGLSWDGDAVSQYGRVERHREVAEQLLKFGKAYYCYCSPEELDAMRAKAEAEKRPIRYDGTWRNRDASEAPAGVKPVIRFKAPQEGETVINDHAQGRVVIPQQGFG
jgi:glutamyl-tRNA synthetase